MIGTFDIFEWSIVKERERCSSTDTIDPEKFPEKSRETSSETFQRMWDESARVRINWFHCQFCRTWNELQTLLQKKFLRKPISKTTSVTSYVSGWKKLPLKTWIKISNSLDIPSSSYLFSNETRSSRYYPLSPPPQTQSPVLKMTSQSNIRHNLVIDLNEAWSLNLFKFIWQRNNSVFSHIQTKLLRQHEK